MKKLLLTKAARADLRKIYAYTCSEWGELQAGHYLKDLRSAMNRISDGTAVVRPLASRHRDIFKLRQGRHLIIFQMQANHQVLVVRVLHERMDIDPRLGKPSG